MRVNAHCGKKLSGMRVRKESPRPCGSRIRWPPSRPSVRRRSGRTSHHGVTIVIVTSVGEVDADIDERGRGQRLEPAVPSGEKWGVLACVMTGAHSTEPEGRFMHRFTHAALALALALTLIGRAAFVRHRQPGVAGRRGAHPVWLLHGRCACRLGRDHSAFRPGRRRTIRCSLLHRICELPPVCLAGWQGTV